MATRISVSQITNLCTTCSMGQFCLPLGLTAEDAKRIDMLVKERIRLEKGQSLFTIGDPFSSVYSIRFGSLTTLFVLPDGRQQITGFHLPGDLVGLDSVVNHAHTSNVRALEDTEVCVIPAMELISLSRELPSLHVQFTRLMSQEISNDHRKLLMIGSLRAEERLAMFLLDLSERLSVRGYSSTEFVLRMSREEIGSYLGMKLETVSRLFSRFAKAGLVRIQQKQVKIIDMDGLRQVL